jgi:ribosome-associated toxin RatA of RatAB toxin-antitoxin module
MISIDREKFMPYSATQLYALVNDIERYPEFIPGCTSVQVISRTPTQTHASIRISVAGLRSEVTTRNYCEPPGHMHMVQANDSLGEFNGDWWFKDQRDGCLVRFKADIEIRSRMLGMVADRLGEKAMNLMVDVMCRRAKELYG